MRWRVRPVRQADDFSTEGEAALRPFKGIAGVELATAGLSGKGIGGSNSVYSLLQASGQAGAASQHSARSEKLARLQTDEQPSMSSPEKISAENANRAQPSNLDGVPEDMTTLVLDNPVLGVGTASLPDSSPDAIGAALLGLDPASDAAVMLRAAAGDESSFNYLVEKYHRPMIHFLYRMVRNEAVAEELAQEVFLRVYRSRESYRAEAKFSTWLYRIATNLAVNHARDTKHQRAAQTVYLDAPDPETGTTPDLADPELTAELQLLQSERMKAIRTHVLALPERQRMAVVMHKYQGMDYKQIGEVLKLSESATKSLLFRAYQTLRETLRDFVDSGSRMDASRDNSLKSTRPSASGDPR